MTSPNHLKGSWDEGVICKHCGGIHMITGHQEHTVPIRNVQEKTLEVWCQKDGTWHEHDREKDMIYRQSSLADTGNAQISVRIVEIENRISKLEKLVGEQSNVPISERLSKLEELTTQVAEKLLTGKETQTPKGRVA